MERQNKQPTTDCFNSLSMFIKTIAFILQESISTCRFAQRVALIKNDVMLNEELDPKLMIQKLKREIQQLKEELAMATGEQRTDELTDEDLERSVIPRLICITYVVAHH